MKLERKAAILFFCTSHAGTPLLKPAMSMKEMNLEAVWRTSCNINLKQVGVVEGS